MIRWWSWRRFRDRRTRARLAALAADRQAQGRVAEVSDVGARLRFDATRATGREGGEATGAGTAGA